MGRDELLLICLLLYRLMVNGSGILSMYFGYRLLSNSTGNSEKPSRPDEMAAKHGSSTVVLRTSRPGLFFALFGAAVLIAGLIRPPEFASKTEERIAPVPTARSEQPPNTDTPAVVNPPGSPKSTSVSQDSKVRQFPASAKPEVSGIPRTEPPAVPPASPSTEQTVGCPFSGPPGRGESILTDCSMKFVLTDRTVVWFRQPAIPTATAKPTESTGARSRAHPTGHFRSGSSAVAAVQNCLLAYGTKSKRG
jgi:hypothetical protein